MIIKRINILLIILSSLMAGGWFVLYSNQGLNFIFFVATKIIPGTLTASKLDGNLLGSIHAKKLQFKNNTFRMAIDKLQCTIKITALLSGKAPITTLDADNIEFNIQDTNAALTTNPILNTKDFVTKIQSWLTKFSILENCQLRHITLYHNTAKQGIVDQLVIQSHIDTNNHLTLHLELLAYNTLILIQGLIKDTWNITCKIKIPNLKLLFPKVSGSFVMTGKIFGKHNKPQLEASLQSTNFNYKNVSYANFTGTAQINLAQKSSFTLNIDNPKFNDISVNQLALTGTINAKTNGFNFNIITRDSRVFLLPKRKDTFLCLKQVDLHGDFDNKKGLAIKTQVFVDNNNPVDINFDLPKLNQLTNFFSNQPIQGKITYHTENLNFFQTLFPHIKNPKGMLDIKYKISGVLEQPYLEGSVILANANLSIPDLNIPLRQIDLTLQNTQTKINYQATIHGKEGILNMSGEASFADNKFIGNIHIDGKDFLLANTKQYRTIITPTLLIDFDNNILTCTGTIFIPRAVIKPQEFSSYNILPAELKYTATKEQPDAIIDIHSTIKLVLGENVSANIMGLTGTLIGELQITDVPQKLTTANGKLYINDAYYNVYGKKLKVTKGELHFLGGAITNPEVEFKTIRDFSSTIAKPFFKEQHQNLMVGVKIAGMLDEPKIQLFSTPAGLSDTDILSYLILGKPIDNISENSTQLLLQASATMNIGSTNKMESLIDNIKEKLGFTELGFTEEVVSVANNTNKKTDTAQQKTANTLKKSDNKLTTSTAFILGKYLSPRLYISYGNRFLDQVSVFRIKYFISKYFSLCSESSSLGNSSLDLMYTVEK